MQSGGEKGHPSGRVHLGTLRYPGHVFNPESLLNFTELKGFQDDWDDLGLNVEDDLGCLQVEIMTNPRAGELVPGTGSLRKLEFGPPSWDRRKRYPATVLYVYFQEFGHVLLVHAEANDRSPQLTLGERKKIKQLIDEERRILNERYFT